MRRLFGLSKEEPAPKEAPSLSEASSRIDEQVSALEAKIVKTDEEIRSLVAKGSSNPTAKSKALQAMKKKKMYEQQRARSRGSHSKWGRQGHLFMAPGQGKTDASLEELDEVNGTSCRNFILKGKVQMVHYRNWAVGKASHYGVKGWVANGGDKSYDGSHSPCPTCGCVLGHVEGSGKAVSGFLKEMCRGGPAHSYVSSCKVENAGCYGCRSFYKENHFCQTWTVSHCKSRC
ncbi:unnamed protein product [Effrenium voratum]|nr:unnamed protein product [Effrenium voratum]